MPDKLDNSDMYANLFDDMCAKPVQPSAEHGHPQVTSRLLQVIKSHKSDILTCAFSGHTLATGSADKLVRLWSIEAVEATEAGSPRAKYTVTELPQSPLVGHKYAVLYCAFTPAGTSLATCSQDGRCILWDTATGHRLHVFEHSSHASIRVCSFSPDSRLLVTGCDDESACLWDTASRKLIRNIEGHEASVTAVAFTPDSNYLVTGTTSGDLRVWDSRFGQGRHLLHMREAHDLGVNCAQFSPVVGAEGYNPENAQPCMYLLATGGTDDLLKLWRVYASPTADNEITVTPYTQLSGQQQNIMSLQFSPDGGQIASGAGDKTVVIWDCLRGVMLHRISHHKRYVTCCAFSSDGTLLASGSNDKTVAIFSMSSTLYDDEQPLIALDDVSVSQTPRKRNGSVPTLHSRSTVDDVCAWLSSELSLPAHVVDRFRANGIDGRELLHLTDSMLHSSLSVDSLGDRNRLLRAVKQLRSQPRYFSPPPSAPSPDGSHSTSPVPADTDTLPFEYYCPITHELMQDPVIAADGYTYERAAIASWIDGGRRSSPMTNAPLGNLALTPNRSLKMLIQRAAVERDLP